MIEIFQTIHEILLYIKYKSHRYAHSVSYCGWCTHYDCAMLINIILTHKKFSKIFRLMYLQTELKLWTHDCHEGKVRMNALSDIVYNVLLFALSISPKGAQMHITYKGKITAGYNIFLRFHNLFSTQRQHPDVCVEKHVYSHVHLRALLPNWHNYVKFYNSVWQHTQFVDLPSLCHEEVYWWRIVRLSFQSGHIRAKFYLSVWRNTKFLTSQA